MDDDKLKKIIEEELELEKMRIFAQVEEEIESAKRSMLTKIKSYNKDENQTSKQTSMKLEFRNRIARTILTGEEIKGEGGVPIEVVLVDEAGDVVDDEPEAFANVEIVLLKGKPDASDWTTEEFNANIVPRVEGKQPILAGNVDLPLERGVRIVENIKIRHHASKIKPPEFMLGARVVGDCGIKEAKTESFILKDFRIKYKQKRENPSLSDEVSRLVSIAKGGKIHKRLQENKIYTVEDFLIQLLINPQGLKSIVKHQETKWKATIENARACLSGERMYCYIDLKHKTGVVFNILGHVLGLCSGSYYSQTSTLSEEQKAGAEELLASAYKNWGQVKAFDDQNSLQQHLAGFSPYIEMVVGESSNKRSNVPLIRGANSTMNSFGETGVVQDFVSFTATCSDDDFFDGLDEELNRNGWSRLCVGLMEESNNAYEGSGAASSEPLQAVSWRKIWKKLFCVITFRKRVRVSLDVGSPNRKKQKVG